MVAFDINSKVLSSVFEHVMPVLVLLATLITLKFCIAQMFESVYVQLANKWVRHSTFMADVLEFDTSFCVGIWPDIFKV